MSLDVAYIITRFLHFAALYLWFGVSVYVECLASAPLRPIFRKRTQAMLYSGVAVSCACAPILLCLQGGQMGNGWPDVFDSSVWVAVLGTSFGEAWSWQLGLSVLAVLLVLTGPGRRGYTALLVFSASMLFCMAFVGHAASHDGYLGMAARLNQAVHLFSGAYWLGCLAPLLLTTCCLRTEHRPEVIRTHRRFSGMGHVAVVAVIASGLVNTGLVLGAWPLQWSSPYQRLLLLKILLVSMMAVLAIVNRYVLVPRMNRGPQASVALFDRLVSMEIVLGIGVLGLVSWFATLEPA